MRKVVQVVAGKAVELTVFTANNAVRVTFSVTPTEIEASHYTAVSSQRALIHQGRTSTSSRHPRTSALVFRFR